jgi:RND family efflux transporter MFP subunit
MRHFLIPFLLIATAAAAEPAAPPPASFPVIPFTAQQAKALGVETQALAAAGAGLAAGLPAQVVVPNEQLRVVAAPLAGLVVRIDVAPGQAVKKGQALARLASPALLGVERDYLQAAQQAQVAAQAAKRDEQLFSEGIIAEARHQATRSNYQQAAVALAARREELRLAGVSEAALSALQKNRGLPSELLISAPIDGIVLEQSAQAGQRVEAAAPLFRIGKLAPLWVEIQTPAALAAQLREGLPVRIAAVGASGTIINVGRQISAGNQTVSVRARLDTGIDKLSPGQMVEASIDVVANTAADSNGFRIAQSAVIRIEGKAFVFVAEAEGFRPQPITVTGQAGEQVLLQSPALKPETRIAVKGLAALKGAWLGAKAE